MRAQGDLKYCPGCKQDKSLSEFSKDKYAPDGLTLYCRACSSARKRVPDDQRKRAHKSGYTVRTCPCSRAAECHASSPGLLACEKEILTEGVWG